MLEGSEGGLVFFIRLSHWNIKRSTAPSLLSVDSLIPQILLHMTHLFSDKRIKDAWGWSFFFPDGYKPMTLLYLFSSEPANCLISAVLPLTLSRQNTGESCQRSLCWSSFSPPNATEQIPHQEEALTVRDLLFILCVRQLGSKCSFTHTKSWKNINCLQKIVFCHFLTISPFPHSPYFLPTPLLPHSFLQFYVGQDAFQTVNKHESCTEQQKVQERVHLPSLPGN